MQSQQRAHRLTMMNANSYILYIKMCVPCLCVFFVLRIPGFIIVLEDLNIQKLGQYRPIVRWYTTSSNIY